MLLYLEQVSAMSIEYARPPYQSLGGSRRCDLVRIQQVWECTSELHIVRHQVTGGIIFAKS
jgi:hypothetical protein